MGAVDTVVDGQQCASAARYSVVAEAVEVDYRVYLDRKRGLREFVGTGFKRRAYRHIHALRKVSFSAVSGEGIGVIGSNGSGKSTLMRAISGLLPVSAGRVYASDQPRLL